MPYLLRFHSGRYAEHTLELPESVTLGRAPAFGVALDDDAAASSEHCRIVVREDGRVEIEDLDSTNGTEVNGLAIRTAELRAGDKILIGATRLTLEAVEPTPSEPAAEPAPMPASSVSSEPASAVGRQGTDNPGAAMRQGTDPDSADAGDPVVEAHPARPHPKTRIAPGRERDVLPDHSEVSRDLASPVNETAEPDAHLSAPPPSDAPLTSPPPSAEEASVQLQGENVAELRLESGSGDWREGKDGTPPISRSCRSRRQGTDNPGDARREGAAVSEPKRASARRARWRRAAAVLVALGLAAMLVRGCGAERNMVSARAARAAWRQMGREGVTLTVSAPEGAARTAEPLTVGVPLPKGRVRGPDSLALLGPDGVPVPCQIAAQSRWPDGSVKWVLLDFQADVATNGPSAYRLAMREAGPAPERPVRATLDVDGATLETAGLKLTVRRNEPGLIHAATANGRETIRADAPAQAVLTDAEGREYRASKPDLLELEVAGPMRSTLLVRGHFAAEDGTKIFGGKVGYDLRIHVYAGKPYARLAFTLRNDGWYGYRNESPRRRPRPRQWLYLKGLDLDVPLAAGPTAGEPWRVGLGGTELALERGQAAIGTQWYKYATHGARKLRDETALMADDLARAAAAGMEPLDKGFYWTLERTEGAATEQGAMPGRIGLADADGHPYAGLAVRRFRENFPAGLAARAGQDGRAGLSFRMFPPDGYWPRTPEAWEKKTVQFEGGRRKTADLLLWFGEAGAATDASAELLDAPLHARAPTAWYRDSAAILPLANGGLGADDPELNEALARYDRLQRAKVLREAGDAMGPDIQGFDDWGKVSIPHLWKSAPDDFMGWMNYGDLIWTFGYCSLYYGWPYLMLTHWLRLGDREFMDVAEDMVRHRYDIDQYHVEDTATWLGGFQRLERGQHGHLSRQEKFRGRNTSWEGNARPSHTWNRGLLLHWALTGDARSLEAARQNGRAFHRFFYGQHKLNEKDALPWGEYRTPAWAMDNWLALYEYTGESEWLELANEIFSKTLLAMEEANGRQGHILEEGRQTAQFVSYVVEPVCRLHHWTGRKDAVGFLDRVLRWQRAAGSSRGFEKNGLYWPTVWVSGVWVQSPDETQPADTAHIHYGMAFSDGYAYLGHVLRDREHRAFARQLFREYMFYHGLKPDGVPREARTLLGYQHMRSVFLSTPKIHAFSGRYGQLFMSVEEGL